MLEGIVRDGARREVGIGEGVELLVELVDVGEDVPGLELLRALPQEGELRLEHLEG